MERTNRRLAHAARVASLASALAALTGCTLTLGTPIPGVGPDGGPGDGTCNGASCAPGDGTCTGASCDPGGGGAEGEGAGSGGGAEGEGGGDPGVPSTPLRRLTKEELNRTLRDLFAGIAVPSVTLNDGDPPSRGTSFEGDVARQTPSDLVVDQMRVGAVDVAMTAIARHDLLLAREPGADAADQRAVGHDFIASFGARALRRPLSQRELDAYDALFDGALADDFDTALAITIEAFLQAPSFLYRVETGDAASAPYAMASRLSYLLWGTMPDQALFDAAAADALGSADQLEAQARRMLADARAKDAVLSFHRQWLDFDKVLAQNKDASTYPAWSDALATSIRREADAIVDEAVFGSGDGKLRTILTTTTTRLDANLAALYGVAAPAHDWDLVTLPGTQRAGVLTQGAFLASRAHAVFPSPVLRGVYVLDRFLCQAPPPPGGTVNTNPPTEDTSAPATTNRARYEQHTADPNCQACHVSIDGIGMGFESYDAIGRFRTTDNGFPVDDSGTLTPTGAGGDFAGATELASLLASSPDVEDCVARHWLTWLHGRAEEVADTPQIDEVSAAFTGADGDIRALLIAVVRSPAFRTLPTEVTP